MVAFHLILKFFHSVSSISVALQLFPPIIISIKQLTLEEP